MARTKRRKGAGIAPAQRTLHYAVPVSSGAFDVTLDIAKDLSAVNRRLYRQGMQYYIQNVKIATGKGKVVSVVSTAGDTWIVHNAWKKGYLFWREQQKIVSDNFPSIQGKWADFKVTLWDGASAALDSFAGGDAVAADEWNYSNYVWDDDGTERSPTFTIIGATVPTSKIGMIQEYALSRARPAAAPTLDNPSESIYSKSLVNDEAMVALIDVIESENDLAPYDMDQYVGADTQSDEPLVQNINFASEFAPSNTGGFTAECGLVRIAGTSQLSVTFPHATAGDNTYDDIHYLEENLDDSLILQVTVAPGPYKGVMASKMGQ